MEPNNLKVGQKVRVLGCPDHDGCIGVVLDAYSQGRVVRVGFEAGSPCWPRRVEVVDDAPREDA